MAGKPVLILSQRPFPHTANFVPIRDGMHTRRVMVCTECKGKQCCELSLGLRNNQHHIGLIEEKYGGGAIDTQQAAQIIQYNFRQYSLAKKFEQLRSSHDRRLMKDVPSDRDSVWSDVEVSSHPSSPHLPPPDSYPSYLPDSYPPHLSENYSPHIPPPDHYMESNNISHRDIASQRERNGASISTVVYVNSFPPVSANGDEMSYSKDHSISYSPTNDQSVSQRGLYERGRARKRKYRIGLIIFNKTPELGLKYLMEQKYLANSAQAVAEFLVGRKGLSRDLIGEYLGNLQKSFNQDVLTWVVRSLKLSGLEIDQALRKLVGLFRFPGEAQKIERIMERFSQWYITCNPTYMEKFHSTDIVLIISFAIVMLNTDLHSRNIKPASKMTLDQFIKNMRGIDDGKDLPLAMLTGIYERIQAREFRTDPDHVSQVRKVEESLMGNSNPPLAIPPRRLVCYCRLYEIPDPTKKEKLGLHQREVFLFNDVLVVTKIFAKKKDVMTYTYRRSISLNGLVVQGFTTEHYQFGIKLLSSQSRTPLICFNARNTHDREKFVDDLIETVTEVKEYRSIQLGTEPKKRSLAERSRMSKDSGVADLELINYVASDPVCSQHLPVRATAEESRSSSLTELQTDKTLTKSTSNRSVDSCVVSKKLYHV